LLLFGQKQLKIRHRRHRRNHRHRQIRHQQQQGNLLNLGHLLGHQYLLIL
jgi:hypothetical protein